MIFIGKVRIWLHCWSARARPRATCCSIRITVCKAGFIKTRCKPSRKVLCTNRANTANMRQRHPCNFTGTVSLHGGRGMEGQISHHGFLSAHLPATPARRMHQRRLATDRHRQTGHAGPGRRIPKGLIPSNRTTRIASLIPLQGIGQHTGVGTDREVIRSKRTEHQSATSY